MVPTKKSDLSESQAITLLHDLFKQFQIWIRQAKDPTLSEIGKIFTSDFQLFSNGLLGSKDLSDHLHRLAKLRKKYARIEIEGPFEEPLVCHNKLAVYYALRLIPHSGQESQVAIMATAMIEDNKFKRWTQVAHERKKDWMS